MRGGVWGLEETLSEEGAWVRGCENHKSNGIWLWIFEIYRSLCIRRLLIEGFMF